MFDGLNNILVSEIVQIEIFLSKLDFLNIVYIWFIFGCIPNDNKTHLLFTVHENQNNLIIYIYIHFPRNSQKEFNVLNLRFLKNYVFVSYMHSRFIITQEKRSLVILK